MLGYEVWLWYENCDLAEEKWWKRGLGQHSGAESRHFQASTEDVHFYEMLATGRTKRIRDFC